MFTKNSSFTQAATVLGMITFTLPIFGADGTPIATPTAAVPTVTAAPATTTPATAVDPADLVAHYRGGPATAADFAEMAPLKDLPVLTPGAGEGDYQVKPPYAPASPKNLGPSPR